MAKRLTKAQRRALKMTQRGLSTIIVRSDQLHLQPADLVEAILEMPALVAMGLRTQEELAPGVIKYGLTTAGRSALNQPEPGGRDGGAS